MGIMAALFGALLAAAYLRKKNKRAFPSIALAGLILPAIVAFVAFIYPADPKDQMWAMIAIPVSYAWGLVAAAIGFGFMALANRSKGDA